MEITPIPENSIWHRGKQIGQGSFGTVHLAVSPTTNNNNTLFAVKSVNTATCTPNQLAAIENEITILNTLSPSPSPYIVNYLSSDFTTDRKTGTVYRNLHLEYIPGSITAADFHSNKVVDDNESLLRRYIWCVVSALREVHAKGYVHGDVKGRNVLIDSSRGIAKLADFGSAGGGWSGKKGKHLMMMTPRGSPLWMAPEVVRGESQGCESDVWSLGCTVIEMVTGKPAWEDEGGRTLYRIGYSDELPAVLTEGVVLSDLVSDFVDKCLRREAEMRWSCEELLNHPFLKGQGVVDVGGGVGVSPRSVIDWPESEDEEDETSFEGCCGGGESVEQRIGKLVTGGFGGVMISWESDDEEEWMAVRGCKEEQVVAAAAEREGEVVDDDSSSDDVECGSHETEEINGGIWEEEEEVGTSGSVTSSSEVEAFPGTINDDDDDGGAIRTRAAAVAEGKQTSCRICVLMLYYKIGRWLTLLSTLMLLLLLCWANYAKLNTNSNNNTNLTRYNPILFLSS